MSPRSPLCIMSEWRCEFAFRVVTRLRYFHSILQH